MTESELWQTKWHGLHDVLGPKWALHIIRLLSEAPQGFNEIKNELDGLTAPVLSQRLKELRCHGLIERTVIHTTPPSTTYSLTDQGSQITAYLRQLESLVDLHTQEEKKQGCGCTGTSQACRAEALTEGCVTVVDHC